MDVTPQELRSSEIKDSWRGYDRDEVDDLLERAAVTIESLTTEVQEARSRPAPAPAPTGPDAVNITNTPQWGYSSNPSVGTLGINTNINSPSFGRITSAAGNRLITFYARVDF